MTNFDINLCINDFICVNNCKDVLQKDINVTSTSQSICLHCGYLLNIIRVQDNSFTILLQNGFQTYIRNIFFNESFQICLPCKNGTRILTICGTLNT